MPIAGACTRAEFVAALTASCSALDGRSSQPDSSRPRGVSLVQDDPVPLAEVRAVPFTPRIPPDLLREFLRGYDVRLADRIILGFRHGFSTGCKHLPTGRAQENLPSCIESPQSIDAYIQKECQAGRIAGPFPRDYPGITKISPIGLIPKKATGSFRVIHHLSFPAGVSVNDFIPRECTTVTYGSIDEAVRQIAAVPEPYLADFFSNTLTAAL